MTARFPEAVVTADSLLPFALVLGAYL
ncbi:MAG: hypothetical protein RLZ44_1783, partial [Pseudomonadota bacterium]